jgi:hypothetical protein
MANKLTIEEVRARGLEKGFYLNSETYINAHGLLNWSCKAQWHSFPANWSNISQDKGCPDCAQQRIDDANRLSIEYIRKVGLEKGFYLNSETYINNRALLDWSCKIGWHHFKACFYSIDQNQGCPDCFNENRGNDIEYVRKVGLEKGFYLNSETYINGKTLLSWSCVAEWHPFKMRFSNIDQNQGCSMCALKYNKWEDGIFSKLLAIFPYLLQKTKRILKNKRFHLDIWDPTNRKAVELDGDYWHNRPKQIESDIRKNQECVDAGVRLLRVKFSDYTKNPEVQWAKIIEFLS